MAEHNQRFDTFIEWVNKAPSWLTRRPGERAICFDQQGRICQIGGDFMRARDEDTFPVQWVWPDQVPAMLAALEEIERHAATLARSAYTSLPEHIAKIARYAIDVATTGAGDPTMKPGGAAIDKVEGRTDA